MNQECCAPFDPLLYDDKVFNWKNKKFIKVPVKTFFYMPLNFGAAMEKIGSYIELTSICMSEHTSKWKMNVYAEVVDIIPDFENAMLSGKFYFKVYEGKFSNTGKWMKDFAKQAINKNLVIKKTYMWYTTCPKCAKKYGKNYVVVIGECE